MNRQAHIEAVSEIMSDASRVLSAVNELSSNAPVKSIIFDPIHEDCVQHALEMIQLYYEDARLSSWERRAIAQAKKDPSNDADSAVESDETIQMIDLIIEELTLINEVSARYSLFVKSLAIDLSDDKLQNKVCTVRMEGRIIECNELILESRVEWGVCVAGAVLHLSDIKKSN